LYDYIIFITKYWGTKDILFPFVQKLGATSSLETRSLNAASAFSIACDESCDLDAAQAVLLSRCMSSEAPK